MLEVLGNGFTSITPNDLLQLAKARVGRNVAFGTDIFGVAMTELLQEGTVKIVSGENFIGFKLNEKTSNSKTS